MVFCFFFFSVRFLLGETAAWAGREAAQSGGVYLGAAK